MQSVVDALCMVVLRTLVNACIYMLVWCTAKTVCANMHAAIGSACLFGVLLGPACAGLNRSSDLIRHMCRGLMPVLSCFTGALIVVIVSYSYVSMDHGGAFGCLACGCM